MTGQDESSQTDTTDTSGGSAANATTSGGSTVEPWPGEGMLLGNTTLQGVEASSAALGGSAVTAFPWGSPVVVYVAQMQHSAIPTLESVSDRVTFRGQEGQSEWVSGDQLCVQTLTVYPSRWISARDLAGLTLSL